MFQSFNLHLSCFPCFHSSMTVLLICTLLRVVCSVVGHTTRTGLRGLHGVAKRKGFFCHQSRLSWVHDGGAEGSRAQHTTGRSGRMAVFIDLDALGTPNGGTRKHDIGLRPTGANPQVDHNEKYEHRKRDRETQLVRLCAPRHIKNIQYTKYMIYEECHRNRHETLIILNLSF